MTGRHVLDGSDAPERHVTSSFCRICAAQCGIQVEIEGPTVLSVRGDRDHPLSAGYTCPKGRALPALHHDPARVDHPHLGRRPDRRAASWEEALDDLVPRLQGLIEESGPDSVGVFLGTGGLLDGPGATTVRRFVKAIGTRSFFTTLTIDGPSRPYVGTLMAGQPALFAHAIDYSRATMTLLVGTNPVVSHGHTNVAPNPRGRLRALTARGEVWVVDPRRTETAAMATRHVAPRPGTDHAWLAALVRDVLHRCDVRSLRSEANGVDDLMAAVEPYTLDVAARLCRIPLEDLVELRDALTRHGRFSGVTGTGLTMARTANLSIWLMYVLQIITGSIDAPGGTWYNPGFVRSLDHAGPWGSGTPRSRPGPRSRASLPQRFGERPAVAIVDEIEAGHIRALIGVGVHPVTCLPESDRTAAALKALDVYVAADITENGSTDLATHLLPCTGQLERPDISHAGEQYLPEVAVQYTPRVVAPAAQRRDLWWLIASIAERLGTSALPAGMNLETATAEDLFHDLMVDCPRADFAALRLARVLVAEDAVFGWVREGVAARGGWEIAPRELVDLFDRQRERDLLAVPQHTHDLLLTPRRQLRHMNSGLVDHSPEASVLLHPVDAARAGVVDGGRVRVHNARGSLEAVAEVTEDVAVGSLSVPHGFETPSVNALTDHEVVDPSTGMPQYSGVHVLIEPA